MTDAYEKGASRGTSYMKFESLDRGEGADELGELSRQSRAARI
jgi:hypothetical protein